jgi:hypothetical protein
MHLQTLLISMVDTPLIGLDEMYEAPDHHWQKARGEPKSFLIEARTGSVELQEDFAGAAWTRCPKAIAQTSQVMKVERRSILTHAYQAGKQASEKKKNEQSNYWLGMQSSWRWRSHWAVDVALRHRIYTSVTWLLNPSILGRQRTGQADISNFHNQWYRLTPRSPLVAGIETTQEEIQDHAKVRV